MNHAIAFAAAATLCSHAWAQLHDTDIVITW